jgi:hypothetical protein
MKKYTFILSFLIVFIHYGQAPVSNHWSIDVGIGANKPINPFASGFYSNTVCFPAINVTSRYMVNSFYGFSTQINYNQFKFDNFGENSGSQFFKTNYLSFSLSGVANLGQVFKFYEFAPRLGFLTSLGIGGSSHFNDSLKFGVKGGADQMINFQLSFTPTFKISSRVSLFAQFNIIEHVNQDNTFDLKAQVNDRGLNGSLLTGTVGASIALGKEKEHVDWFSKDQFVQQNIDQMSTKRDSLLATLIDHPENTQNESTENTPILSMNEPEALEEIDGVIEFPEKLELFYTVQVGYYLVADSVDYSQKFGFEAIRKALPNGGERYFYGFFDDVEQAKDVREALVNSTMEDAFVVPYYQGKRITNAQAEKLLLKYGQKILLPKTESN